VVGRNVTSDDEREHLSWDEFGVAARDLAGLVVASGFEPTVLLVIARGGLPVGGAVSYALDLKNCCAINVEYYTGVDERLEVPVILPPALNLVDLIDTQLLVVDDVADTGHTLKLVADTIRPHVADLRTAVLYEKSRSVVRCDYVWRRTDRWIDFPWSTLPPVERERVT
jgi:hypoxanthine phosphoribosyltransferase